MSKDVAIKAKAANSEKNGVFKKISRFFKDLKSETKKIVWPTKKTVFHNTGVVIVFMTVIAIGLILVDLLFASIVKWVF